MALSNTGMEADMWNIILKMKETAMFATLFRHDSDTAKLHDEIDHCRLEFIEGRLQRVDYLNQKLRLIADDGVWAFTVGPGCMLYFDDQRAILRCFQPLDHVRILFVNVGSDHLARSMCAREKPLPCANQRQIEKGAPSLGDDKLSEKPPSGAGDSRPTWSLT